MLQLYYNLMVLPDWCHRCWNDVQKAMSDMNWSYSILVGTIILNCDHGRWNGHQWYEMTVAGAREFIHVVGDTEPSFAYILHNIAEDQTCAEQAGTLETRLDMF